LIPIQSELAQRGDWHLLDWNDLGWIQQVKVKLVLIVLFNLRFTAITKT